MKRILITPTEEYLDSEAHLGAGRLSPGVVYLAQEQDNGSVSIVPCEGMRAIGLENREFKRVNEAYAYDEITMHGGIKAGSKITFYDSPDIDTNNRCIRREDLDTSDLAKIDRINEKDEHTIFKVVAQVAHSNEYVSKSWEFVAADGTSFMGGAEFCSALRLKVGDCLTIKKDSDGTLDFRDSGLMFPRLLPVANPELVNKMWHEKPIILPGKGNCCLPEACKCKELG